jgi:sugar lactone lactonase YvrE/DNA-binding CsgD family transcriptional regulator
MVVGLFVGASTVILCIAWTDFFTGLDLRQSILKLSILCGFAAIIDAAYLFIDLKVRFLVFTILLVIGIVGPLVRVWESRNTQKAFTRQSVLVNNPQDLPELELPVPEQIEALNPVKTLQRLPSVILMPLIGFLLFGLTSGVRISLVLDVLPSESVSTLLAAVFLAPLCFIHTEKPLLSLIYQVFIPLVAALLLLLNFFPEQTLIYTAGRFGINVFFCIIGLLSLSAFTAVVNAREFSASFVFGFAIAAFCIVSLIGLRFRNVISIGEALDSVLWILYALYLIYLILWPTLRGWKLMFTTSEESSLPSTREGLKARIEYLSDNYDLSNRESEILFFLGRGYSPAFISKELFLSDSTVRTYDKRIYRKLPQFAMLHALYSTSTHGKEKMAMSKTINETKTLINEGVVWGEGPRWHDGVLYFSDIFGKRIFKTDDVGNKQVVVEVPGIPSGTGFLPDGRLLIVTGIEGKLYTLEDSELVEYVDVYKILEGTIGINDMVVNSNGNAYVGCYGYDITKYRGGPAPGWIALVTPDKKVVKAGEDIMCPNGMVISPDGSTLIAADTIARVLVAYTIESDGTLSDRRIFAALEDGPDGISIDAEGAIWAALPHVKKVVRVKEGGEVTHQVMMKNRPLACMLGGSERKTLFIITVTADDINDPGALTEKASYVEYVEDTEISGAGLP